MSDTARVDGRLEELAGGRRPATMSDVARAAGFSHQTVSRVLNGSPAVSAETRERVLAAIKELGYRRNSVARALATRRSHALGVISINTTLFGPASTLFSVEQAAREAGYSVTVASLTSINAETLREALDHLAERSIEGLIAIAPFREAMDALVSLRGQLPLVVAEGGLTPELTTVSVDQAGGARLATRHLLSQGASTVWHVAGPADWLEAEARVASWRAELAKSGIQAPELLRGDWSPASGYAAGRSLAARRNDVPAVFAANDQMALGLLRAFHEEGIRVPQDVLVAGFDDIPEAAYYTPPLTTVRQDFATVGRHSIELLLEQIVDGVRQQRHAVVAPELVIRHSSVRLPVGPVERAARRS